MFRYSGFPAVRHGWVLVALAAVSTPVLAQTPAADAVQLEEVSVVAVKDSADKLATPVSVMSRKQLVEEGAGTLGEALNGLPGVHMDSFGGGVSRPVVRGQSQPRVTVLSSGSALLDASDVSPDHAITADPLLAERIEVIRGPATLLYGGGAIGGVVNVVDNKVPSQLPEGGSDGQLVLRGDTVADARSTAGEISTRLGELPLVLHAQGSFRHAGDYRVPDLKEMRVDGSHARSNNTSFGLSWVKDWGYLGLAYSQRSDNYGLPGHSHEFEGCHPVAGQLDAACGAGGHHHHGHHHPAPEIDLDSSRYDLRAAVEQPFAGFSELRFRASYTDYQHDEVEIGEGVTTTFSDSGYQARVELEHQPVAGFTGTIGMAYADTQAAALGVEGLYPEVDSTKAALFVVEHYQLNDQWLLQAGARQAWQEHSPSNDMPSYSDSSTALSAAAIWSFRPDWALTLSVAHSERLPTPQELYADGAHIATNTYECGLLPSLYTCGGGANDRESIARESSLNYELGLRKTKGRITFGLSAYVNQVDDYIYARTLDSVETFRLIKYSQADVTFQGLEGEVSYRLNKALKVTAFGDVVLGELRDGGNELPRIPAARVGGRLNYVDGRLDGELELYRVAEQEHIAGFESVTPGHTMANLTLNYYLGNGQTRVFARASNLLDEQVWNHASFLASSVPQPGRNLTLGMSYSF